VIKRPEIVVITLAERLSEVKVKANNITLPCSLRVDCCSGLHHDNTKNVDMVIIITIFVVISG